MGEKGEVEVFNCVLFFMKDRKMMPVMARQEYDHRQLLHWVFTALVTFSYVVVISHAVRKFNGGADKEDELHGKKRAYALHHSDKSSRGGHSLRTLYEVPIDPDMQFHILDFELS
ncbi:hypothetical protein HGM15179_005382 [Zosterops borbonicus]|uniref:Uncharacterized protein n=1 Tax=Zosterops borbonicus TaxID=364589 RepID=A0A8K1GPF8_9PASS|nr:hypothetical protein HGM15179_005382 [Zosterops borbonicus]